MIRNITIAAAFVFVASTDARAAEKIVPESEPVTCYIMVSQLELSVPVGLAIRLCGGTTNAKGTVQCFIEAYGPASQGGLGLPLGSLSTFAALEASGTR